MSLVFLLCFILRHPSANDISTSNVRKKPQKLLSYDSKASWVYDPGGHLKLCV